MNGSPRNRVVDAGARLSYHDAHSPIRSTKTVAPARIAAPADLETDNSSPRDGDVSLSVHHSFAVEPSDPTGVKAEMPR